jgi:hypothetical protein
MNNATRTNVAIIGTILGLSGISHGFFETLQGSTPTGGVFVSAIGEAQRMWPHGNEYAFTVIPNFLISGIVAIVLGLACVVWAVRYVTRPGGPTVFLLLFIGLFLTGGGVAQVILFIPAWIVATRINKPLARSRPSSSGSLGRLLATLWPWLLAFAALSLLYTLVIAVTGFVPGIEDPDAALSVMLALLGAHVVLVVLSYCAGIARDVRSKSPAVES